MGKRSEVSVKDRREAALSCLRREEHAAAIARRYGVSEQSRYRWRDDFLAGGEAALANGKGNADPRQRQVVELDRQIEKRDQVIGELTIANRILRKTFGPVLTYADAWHEMIQEPVKEKGLCFVRSGRYVAI